MGLYVIKMFKDFKYYNKFVGKLLKDKKRKKFMKFV